MVDGVNSISNCFHKINSETASMNVINALSQNHLLSKQVAVDKIGATNKLIAVKFKI